MIRPRIGFFIVIACMFAGGVAMGAPAEGSLIAVTAGGAGALGAGSVGIDWVAKDASSARISVGGTAGGTHWSSHMEVRPHGLVRLAGGVFSVERIVAPGTDHRGQVVFAPNGGATPAADTLLLTQADPVMMGGPEIEAMTAVRLKALQPGGAAAELEWWPAEHAREDADPASVHAATLAEGGEATIGGAKIAVVKVEESPPAVVLRVLGPA
jgi:hypothetical protein